MSMGELLFVFDGLKIGYKFYIIIAIQTEYKVTTVTIYNVHALTVTPCLIYIYI